MFNFYVIIFPFYIFAALQASTSLRELDKSYQSAFQNPYAHTPPIKIDPYQKKTRCPEEYADLIEKWSAEKAHLFHTFNAALHFLSDLSDTIKEDQSNGYRWTYENCSIDQGDGIKFPLETEFPSFLTEKIGNNLMILPTTNSLYEIHRQQKALDIAGLWRSVMFWKKNSFVDNTIESYNQLNAASLVKQINDLIALRKKALLLPNLPDEMRQHFATIINILEDVSNAFPSKIVRWAKNRDACGVVEEEIHALINQRTIKYSQNYQDFFKKWRKLDYLLKNYLINTHEMLLDFPNLKDMFGQRYAEFKDHIFIKIDGTVKKLLINIDPLNLNNLFPSSEQIEIKPSLFYNPEEIEMNPQSPLITDTAHIKKEKNRGMENVSAEENEEIIYNTDYWKKENEYHTLRKSVEQLSMTTEDILPSNQVQEYEQALRQYLAENIFKYKKLKRDTLIQELRDIEFYVEQNTTGKGSVYHVGPLPTNLLFGNDPHYKAAYFNVHLPHSNLNIPPAYFKFLQSGFENIFGLEIER